MSELELEFERISSSNKLSEVNLSKLITTRLSFERLGEVGNNYWWDSRVLSEFGSQKLTELTPKTKCLNQIYLSFEIGKKKEKEFIKDKDYIGLFYFPQDIEKLILSIIKTLQKEKVNELNLFLDKIKDINLLNYNPNISNDVKKEISTRRELIGNSIGAFILSEVRINSLQKSEYNKMIDELIYAWSLNKKGELLIPYYKVLIE